MSSMMAQGRLEVLQIYRLLQYVLEGDLEQIENMLNLGVKNLINLTEPQDGTGVLHGAVTANNLDLINFLLSNKAQPNVQNRRGQTPAMLAAEMGNDAVVRLLIQKQADMKLLDAEGKGVLFYCNNPTKRHTRCLQMALENQADVNNVSTNGVHVFQRMCEKARDCSSLCLIMLDAGADPNATNQETGMTALMGAASAGSLSLVRAILRRGGNPNARDKKRFTAVHFAAMGGFFEVIQVLSAYSADMGVINLQNCTPLHYAAATGNTNCCKFLVQRGCNPKLKNQDSLLPRQIAKDAGHNAAAKELKKAEKFHGKGNQSEGVSLMSDLWALILHDWSNEFQAELQQAFGDTTETVPTERFVLVLEQLNAPVKPDYLQKVVSAHDKKGEGMINITDFIKGVKYIKKTFLLSSYMPKKKKGGKVKKGGKKKKKQGKFVLPMPICTLPPELKSRRPDGGPPLYMIETYYNCSDVHRFDPNHPPKHPINNDSGWYMEKPDKVYVNINYCVQSGNLETLELAFSQGVPVDVQDEYYKTPLMVACSSGNLEVVQYLLSHRADVNKCDQFFWTPLHHAAHAGHLEIVDLLLKAGATIDSPSITGATALNRAIESAKPSCVEFLIKAGANVNAENKKGKNCLDIALEFGNSQIVKLIKDRMDSSSIKKDQAKKMRGKSKSAKIKGVTADGGLHTDTSTATSGKTPTQMDSKSIVLQNTRIAAGKFNAVDISFVPKTVCGKPPSTSQLMSRIEKQREHLSLEFDLDDLLMPFSHDIQKRIIELTKANN